MVLSRDELLELRDECFAEDVALDPRLHACTPDQVRAYFESGGAIPLPQLEHAADASTRRQSDDGWTTLLAAHGLERCAAALRDTPFADALAALDDGRPALLALLKNAGVLALPDRQALAKALAASRRAAVGVGPPRLVCFYSAGLDRAQGRSLMGKFLKSASAAGLADPLVLDHYTDEAFGGCADFDAYVTALVCIIDSDPAHAGRPILLCAHSHGAVAAYGVARRLGKRVRLLSVLARRPPSMPLLPDVWGVSTATEFAKLERAAVLGGLARAYRSPMLLPHADAAEELWPASVKQTVDAVVPLYTSSLALCSHDDITATLGSTPPPIVAPVFAIAATREVAEGETADKMSGWAALTSDSFTLRQVEADHMGLALSREAHDQIIDAMTRYV